MPRLHLPHAPAALLCALCLTGCAVPVPQAHLPVPASLLTCAAEPAVPPDSVDDKELAGWVLDLREAGADCRMRLAAVRGLEAGR